MITNTTGIDIYQLIVVIMVIGWTSFQNAYLRVAESDQSWQDFNLVDHLLIMIAIVQKSLTKWRH